MLSSDEANGINLSAATNGAQNPCITPEQYAIIEQRCNINAAKYIAIKPSENRLPTPLLDWPLKAAPAFTDCSYYFIAAHVDQDNAVGTVKDYDCGAITYDGHRGTDIAISPFPFYKMDNNSVEVIAAAAGTIVDKHDGEYDRNCVTTVGSNLPANYVIIQHADGSRALYWHMKSGKIITKAVGQSVVAGEQLGVVGSSGSSGGAHLHFEIWTGSANTTYIDPFAGACNTLSPSSWWIAQKAHIEPAIIKASVHTTDVVLPSCPTTETLNESTSYTIPFQGAGLSPGYAKFYAFVRNEVSGSTMTLNILNPNSTTYLTWTQTFTGNHNYIYFGYSKKLPIVSGIYTFQAIYGGNTCSQAFEIIAATGVTEIDNLSGITIYPNPSNNCITISGNDVTNGEYKFTLKNIIGESINISSISAENNMLQKTISISDLSDGVYFLSIEKGGVFSNKKFVKQGQ